MRELSLNVLDIAQNSYAAGASLVEIAVSEDTENGMSWSSRSGTTDGA